MLRRQPCITATPQRGGYKPSPSIAVHHSLSPSLSPSACRISFSFLRSEIGFIFFLFLHFFDATSSSFQAHVFLCNTRLSNLTRCNTVLLPLPFLRPSWALLWLRRFLTARALYVKILCPPFISLTDKCLVLDVVVRVR
jgi:hypothetical protein